MTEIGMFDCMLFASGVMWEKAIDFAYSDTDEKTAEFNDYLIE